MKKTQQTLLYVLIIACSIGSWLLLSLSGLLGGVEQETIRWRYLARGDLESSAPIVFVNLDAETVSYMGDRPWDRREFAVLMQALLGPGQAKVVGLDIILSKYGAGSLLDLERAREGDAFLGQTVEQYVDQIVLAAAYTGVKSSTTNEYAILPLLRNGFRDPELSPFPEAPTFPIIKYDVGRLALANVDEELSGGAVPYYVPAFVELSGPRYSFHIMDGAMRQFDHVLNSPELLVDDQQISLVDKDGWAPLTLPKESEMTIFSLGLELFLAANDLDTEAVEVNSDTLMIRGHNGMTREVPLVAEQSIEVNWFEGWYASIRGNAFSMQMVLRNAHALAEASRQNDFERVGELEEWFTTFRDKVVFVGPVDPQLKDISPTPFDREPVPRVGLHANLYRTIQDEAYITRLGALSAFVIITLLTVSVSLFALSTGFARVFSILTIFGYVLVVFSAFSHSGWILPLVAPVGSSLMATVGVVLLRLGSEEWQRRRIKALFGAYVAPKLVDEMVESRQDPQLGGAETEITALFSDVEGFSALSEELSPGQLVSLMNEYLGAMTEVFQSRSGTLDKYIGDAIVTMFGMPVPVSDHAARACLSALEMQERHAELRSKWAESDEWPQSVLNMRTRIGLNTGHAVIGNMGSEMRFNYTMMGDSVNLAARCESSAKSYGVYTMVTEHTLNAALSEGLELNYRKLDRIVVKGRSTPVEIYELWESLIPKELSQSCKSLYEAGLELYFQGDWQSALSKFEESYDYEPAKDYAAKNPSTVLADRCRHFIEVGSPVGWDGVYRMQTK